MISPKYPLLLVTVLAGAPAAELHVAPAGRDSNPGSTDRPLRTLAAAREGGAVLSGGSRVELAPVPRGVDMSPRPDAPARLWLGARVRTIADLMAATRQAGRQFTVGGKRDQKTRSLTVGK